MFDQRNDDLVQLIGNEEEGDVPHKCRFFRKFGGWIRENKRLLLCLLAVTLILIGNGIAVYYVHFRCNDSNCLPIKVMTMNCWGMPAAFGSLYKEERMQGIAEEINKGIYDLYLLEELWMEPDYYTVRAKVPPGYHMTEFRDLSLKDCDGRATPLCCSGLSVISKFPFLQVEFNSYTEHGDWKKATIDGEWFARKGVGRVRIEPKVGVSMDVFVTHTAADPDPKYHNYTNEWYRKEQVKELMESYVTKSTADLVLLAGDFNAGPDFNQGTPYQTVRRHMSNSIEDFFYKLNEWLDTKYATYGNVRNTFSGYIFDPIIYDYIFYKTNSKKTLLYTNWFEIPFFKMKLFPRPLFSHQKEDRSQDIYEEMIQNMTGQTIDFSNRRKRDVDVNDHSSDDVKIISFSDHDAVTSTIYLRF